MCLMKISSNCKLYQKRLLDTVQICSKNQGIKEQPQHWKQIMLNHIMYSISLINYHIQKRPFTTNYLVTKNVFIYFCYPAELKQMSFFKKSKFFTHTGCTVFIHVEKENKICSSSSRQSYNLKQFAEHPVASFVYLPAQQCTSPDFTGAVTQPPPKKK